jgi:hypothetical protein
MVAYKLPRHLVEQAWNMWRDNKCLGIREVSETLKVDYDDLVSALVYRQRRLKPPHKVRGVKPAKQD